MRSLLASLSVTLLACSCATPGGYATLADKWKGQPETNLLAKWGVPDKSHRLESGEVMYQYDRHSTVYRTLGGGPLYEIDCSTTFTVRAGVVSAVSYRGECNA